MSADVKDFQSYLEKKRAEEIAKGETVQSIAQATAVHVEHVTQDPEWDLYLQKLQEHVDRHKSHKDDVMARAMQAAPPDVHQALLFEYWKTVGFLQAMELSMSLPKTLLAQVKGQA